jgi:hypothetical protein
MSRILWQSWIQEGLNLDPKNLQLSEREHELE